MSTALLGRCGFEDAGTPLKGKSEWGLDTLVRKMVGATAFAEAYIATLQQGLFFQGYYLQSWDVDDDPIQTKITLNYKGFVTGGTPVPKVTNQIVTAVGQTEADFSSEGIVNGFPQGRFYRKDLIWSVSSSTTVGDPFGITAQGFRDRYALSARMSFVYRAIQSTFQYFSIGRPAAPRYDAPNTTEVSTIERARITLNDGTILPSIFQNTFNLVPVVIDENISFETVPVIGSPFFECTEVARRSLGTLIP